MSSTSSSFLNCQLIQLWACGLAHCRWSAGPCKFACHSLECSKAVKKWFLAAWPVSGEARTETVLDCSSWTCFFPDEMIGLPKSWCLGPRHGSMILWCWGAGRRHTALPEPVWNSCVCWSPWLCQQTRTMCHALRLLATYLGLMNSPSVKSPRCRRLMGFRGS